MIETIIPKDEQDWLRMRRQDITSTEIACLFGVSPWATNFEIWHRKHSGIETEFQMNNRISWGRRLEASIATGVAEDKGWNIRHKTEYMRDPELRLGASFDYEITGEAVIEIKNVDSLAFKDGWIVDGDNIEAPAHLEIQVQQQLLLTGYKKAFLCALIGGNRVVIIERQPDQEVIKAILSRVKGFWDSVDKGVPPAPDFRRDADFIRTLYAVSTPGKVIDANDKVAALVRTYKDAGSKEKEAKETKDAAKAEILTIIRDAEKVVGDGFSINCGIVGPQHIEYDREGYRDFRVYTKKGAK